ncbi:pectate lyase-domain-containing protein [Xylariomycetidae sp. FL2044]|nr:pectate lyase-domain-containing protein [Xylariomycetidae sp. FL2044]
MQHRLVFLSAASMADIGGVNAIPHPQVTPAPSPAAKKLALRDSMPASSGSSALSDVMTIASGETFDGGMVAYDRGVSCTEGEGGDSDAVFQIENGGTLKNVIIGPNQIEGVHCQGSCTIENVWWSAVCEDAFSVKNQDAGETTYITGGGAFGAEDKVIQHNGAGTVSVSGFTVDDFGKLYRSCGNCDTMYERQVVMDGITASSGSQLCGINSNYGDSCTITDSAVSDVDDVCVTYTGNDTGDEPEENGSGPDGTYCIYDESDVSGAASSGGSGSGSAAPSSSTTVKSSAKATSTSAVATSTASEAPAETSSAGSDDSGDDEEEDEDEKEDESEDEDTDDTEEDEDEDEEEEEEEEEESEDSSSSSTRGSWWSAGPWTWARK